MGFRAFCDNKNCHKEMEPVLDKETDEVFCTECGKTISSLTKFAKAQMISLGQVKREEAKRQAFAVKCANCKKEGAPVLKKGKDLHCASCDKILDNLSKPFAHTIREYLRTQPKR